MCGEQRRWRFSLKTQRRLTSAAFTPPLFEAMKLMTGFVDVAWNVSAQLQTTQRQCDMESSRSPRDRATDRLVELQATLSLVTRSATLAFHCIVWKPSCWDTCVFLSPCSLLNAVCQFSKVYISCPPICRPPATQQMIKIRLL